MRLALYHNLPSGGALRVLEAFVRHQCSRHRIELFLPDSANDEFVRLSQYAAATHRFPTPRIPPKIGKFTELYGISRLGRTVARSIDAGRFDALLACASQVTQSAEILPYLSTPTVYYAPEHFR